MKDRLAELAFEIPSLSDEHHAATVYWDAYRNLVPICSGPNDRQRIMRLLADRAYLQCAALIAERAFPDLTWQARSSSKEKPAHCGQMMAVTTLAVYAQAFSQTDAGHALLAACVQAALKDRAVNRRRA